MMRHPLEAGQVSPRGASNSKVHRRQLPSLGSSQLCVSVESRVWVACLCLMWCLIMCCSMVVSVCPESGILWVARPGSEALLGCWVMSPNHSGWK
jgi:hypothetical protein